MRINNHRTTTKSMKIKENAGERFNLDGKKREDIMVLVIDHNLDWTDAGRKKNKLRKIWKHRQKSFYHDEMNKLYDFTK